MNKALKRNKCRYKETGMYLRMLDRRMQWFRNELAFAGHMGSFHIQRVLKDD